MLSINVAHNICDRRMQDAIYLLFDPCCLEVNTALYTITITILSSSDSYMRLSFNTLEDLHRFLRTWKKMYNTRVYVDNLTPVKLSKDFQFSF